MHPRAASKRGRCGPVIQAGALLAAIMICIALARNTSGSFSVGTKPHDSAVSAASHGEWERNQAKQPIVSALARDVEERFGVRVLTGGEPLPVCAYSMERCENAEAQEAALIRIGRALSEYPEGFFERLSDSVGGVVIELCGSIRSKDASVPETPSAVTVDCLSFRLIALDVNGDAVEYALIHELCHIIDVCLDREVGKYGASWKEAEWMALCPAGFSYCGAYNDAEGVPYALSASGENTAEAPFDPDEVYFINRYSKTFATEDRAVAFETLMRVSETAECMGCPHVIRKLEYYFSAIRECLDPENEWKQPTFWEEKLQRVKTAAGAG